jgi:hypothetical protein
MPVLKGGMFGLTTTTMAGLIATATTTRSQGITSIGLMRCASARSGGGIYTTSSVAVVDADCGGHTGVTINRKASAPPTLFAAAAVTGHKHTRQLEREHPEQPAPVGCSGVEP